MIDALSSNRTNQAFDIGALPGRARSGWHFLDTHVLDASAEELAVDRIPITDQELWSGVFWKRLDDLLGRPLGRRMSRDVKADDAPAVVTQHNKREEYAECRRRYREEIDRHDIANVVVQESSPRLRRWLAMADPVAVHS